MTLSQYDRVTTVSLNEHRGEGAATSCVNRASRAAPKTASPHDHMMRIIIWSWAGHGTWRGAETFFTTQDQFASETMNGIIYLVGLVVVVMFILSFLGLR
jgi:hypothetical protein